jgi:hypothetical protein
MWNTVMCSVDKTCLKTRVSDLVLLGLLIVLLISFRLLQLACSPLGEKLAVVRLSRASIGHYRDIDSNVFSVYLYFLSGSKCSISASLRSSATLSQR